MNRQSNVLVAVSATVALACDACAGQRVPPQSLLDARADFTDVSHGPTASLDPTDVHEADLALQRAEKAWQDDPDSPETADMAMIADRKALTARAEANAIQARQQVQQATAANGAATENQLNQTRQALGATQMQLQQEQADSAAQREKLQQAEAKLKDERDTIAKIAAVKDDSRGMVITLSGEVLFKTGKHDLKPAAMAKLDEIAQTLKDKDQRIAVYGYTDNVGTADANMTLSQQRAQAVRDYLVSKGLPQDMVTATGKGASDPLADNGSIEGRAQNRRVEMVVEPAK